MSLREWWRELNESDRFAIMNIVFFGLLFLALALLVIADRFHKEIEQFLSRFL